MTAFERLDRRLVLVRTLTTIGIVLVAAVPAGLGIHTEGRPVSVTAGMVAAGAVLLVAITSVSEYLRWRATRFRVTDERFEWRFQLIITRRRSLSRDRIRTVDITAGPVHRLFGLATVVIGTGEQSASAEGGLRLDPVSRERAERLRVELLRRPESGTEAGQWSGATGAGAADAADTAVAGAAPGGTAIATLDWRWAIYAPLSFVTLAVAVAALGIPINLVNWFGSVTGYTDGIGGELQERLTALAVGAALMAVLLVGLVVVVAALIGAVGATLLFVEMWWGYRLTRESDGTLRVRRGLLTTRSISIEERRLRGTELVEPLGIRLARAGRVDAVATGMQQSQGGQRTDHRTLLPAAPRRVARAVAATVLDEPDSPYDRALTGHPRAAFTRRLRWALLPVIGLAGVLLAASLLLDGWPGELASGGIWVVLLVVAPLAALLAWDAYRNLGHALAGRYLLGRSGTLRRSTVALQRSGIIGWTIRQSIFQRRVGLVTVEATTAAGQGAYAIPDVAQRDGLLIAEEAVPDLLAPFVERDER
ncbi:PH domain-containing protein [Haloechinothrix sp. LS1_15]|nr:PH domain-containing protein [Haloechinothrix sp. LS1_15]